MHRQQQLHASSARAHHRNVARPLPGAYAGKDLQPACVKSCNRFNRYGVLACALHLRHLRRGAGVNRQHVVVQGRAPVQQHLACLAVYADNLRPHKARPSVGTQAHQIKVNFVIPIVTGHITGQHARIRRVRVGTHQGNAQTRQRLHAKGFEHGYMAMPAADQHQVAQDGAGVGLHSPHCD